ncbi:M3 family oligoendopeptidase [Roseiterribacter gracilis]|uniref:Oligoendopeptidase F n=1 Tax=Roseiterribacter gracilis TaxID=2812848 RepID=A0A8S8XF56_9PROT|nr:oligoendopeptidase F [Rhodospirillales bacterium TMPK1]
MKRSDLRRETAGAPGATGGAAESPPPQSLPRWDLSDLYPGRESPSIEADLQRLAQEAASFAKQYQGKVATLDGNALAAAIAGYERIDEGLSKLVSYAGLVHAEDQEDPAIGRFYQTIIERVTVISSDLIFLSLELNRIEETDIARAYADSEALRHWRPWLDSVRAFRVHQLTDEAEKLLHERHVVGSGAWSRLFDQTIAGLRFPVGGKELPISDTLNLLSEPDEAVRREAGLAVAGVLAENNKLFALITSTLAKDKEIDDRWRRYPRSTSFRNLANQVEDDVVDALAAAVEKAHPRLSHRYYALKAKWFGKEKLNWWDRNAPIPGDDDRAITWPAGRELVLGAYARFSPELAKIGERFFTNAWIDVPPVAGKSSGAFAHPTVPSVHPYLLLNWHGKLRDAMTLAHELGHGVHQVLAGAQGHLLSQTPLTLAETASVFGEMLTFRALVDAEQDPAIRRRMLAAKVEDMLNTVVRQIAFHQFELRVHAERREGELTPERLGEIWLETQRASLGPAIELDARYANMWAYIPHFVHTPFYVYSYAFGDCLVNALYAEYEAHPDGFAEKYFDLLRAGGTKRHKELLAPFGLNAADPAFWARGLSVIEKMIDELEAVS